jgi:predicted kinase
MNWQELSRAPIDDVLVWAEGQAWCQEMAACRQDRLWHAEGDVWTHTKLVCRQLEELDEWAALSPRERSVHLFTALLHDAAKPLTTQVDPATGRTTSPKHAVKGEHLARSILRELRCDLATREEIARLVRYHGRPAFVLERPHPQFEAIRLSWLVSNKLLYLFAVADTRGRSTKETTRPEENLHLFRLVAEENECFDRPYPFANDHARFLFYRSEKPNLYYAPHEHFACTVTLMSGLPGSGKDTWLARHRPDLPVVSLDAVRGELGIEATDDQGTVIQHARDRCRELLRAQTSFAMNATNVIHQTRKRWIDLFVDYGARVEIVYVEPALDVILRRNAQRSTPVPEQVVHGLAAKSEVPTWAECHELVLFED